MADIDTLNSEVAEVAADEASIANDLGKIIADFQAAETALAAEQSINLAGPIAALQALHAKLQADDASIVAADPTTTGTTGGDAPAPSSEPTEAPAT